MAMVDLSTVLSETLISTGGTFCWMAPELLDPPRFGSNGRPTRESDCYALGMVIYEVGQVIALFTMFSHSRTPGFDWSPTVPSSVYL